MSDDADGLLVCRVSELQPGDWIAAGTNLGSLTTAETLKVKEVGQAAQGRVALTLSRAGTIFVNGQLIVQLSD